MMREKGKVTVLVLLMLVLGCGIGSTLAYFRAEVQPVTNTFTVGKVDIELTETWNTDSDADQLLDAWQVNLVPGTEQEKDPMVTVGAGSVNCWVFVTLEESTNFGDYIDYSLQGTGWFELQDSGNQHVTVDSTGAKVYYREVKSSDEEQTFAVLKDNKVKIKANVTEKMLKNLKKETDYPKLTVNAYAVQKYGFNTAYDAWNEVKPQS